MSKLNLLVHLNAYEDSNPSNNPSLSNFKWARDLQGIDITEPESKSLKLQAGQTSQLFSGVVSISDDNTTTYDIVLKSGTANTYVLSHNSGTAPAFRASRSEGSDATTQITVTKNANLLTFTSTGGTALNLIAGGVIVGDKVRIGDQFNIVNRGEFAILARTATSFTIENSSGVAEGPITLGASFADQINIYSSAGVQVGDKVKIPGGFSSVTQGTYEITDVSHDYIEFYSIAALPSESNILTQLNIYNSSKKFLYIESDKRLAVSIDGVGNGIIQPFTLGTAQKPGILLKSSDMFSADITNESEETATIFYVTAE